MKKKILLVSVAFCSLVALLFASFNAVSNSSLCQKNLLSTCASGNDSCYYEIAATGEKCYFDHSLFMDM